MNKALFLYISVFFTLLTSCEDVIDIDLPDPEPRLVVDGLIRVNSEASTNSVSIGLRLSSNFFDQNTPVSNAVVTLTNTNGVESITLNSDNNGRYTAEVATDDLIKGTITLEIVYEGQLYTASNKYETSTPITELRQGESSLFDDESIEIIIGYEDPAETDNYYLLDFDKGKFFTSEDVFYQGQRIEFSYFHDQAEAGDILEVSLLGVNKEFINYMNQILELSGEQGQGPFQGPVSEARGNIVGPDDHNRNFALGYFAISESYKRILEIE